MPACGKTPAPRTLNQWNSEGLLVYMVQAKRMAKRTRKSELEARKRISEHLNLEINALHSNSDTTRFMEGYLAYYFASWGERIEIDL
jgi:hypothetical protein